MSQEEKETSTPQLAKDPSNFDMFSENMNIEEMDLAIANLGKENPEGQGETPPAEDSKEPGKEVKAQETDEGQEGDEQEEELSPDDMKAQLAAMKKELARHKLSLKESEREEVNRLREELKELKGEISKKKSDNQLSGLSYEQLEDLKDDVLQKWVEASANQSEDAIKYRKAHKQIEKELKDRDRANHEGKLTEQQELNIIQSEMEELHKLTAEKIPGIEDGSSPFAKRAVERYNKSTLYKKLDKEIGAQLAIYHELLIEMKGGNFLKQRRSLLNDVEEGIEKKIHSPGSRTSPGKTTISVDEMEDKDFNADWEKLLSGQLVAERK